MANAAIGDRLGLAEGTVRNHVTSILAKLDVTDRAHGEGGGVAPRAGRPGRGGGVRTRETGMPVAGIP